MTVIVTIQKDRLDVNTPFKDPNQKTNYESWPGFIEVIRYNDLIGRLSRTICYRFENREYFENPNLTEEQKAAKLQGEIWCANNNITVTIEIIEE
jgi:hypothetical protein